ncbi:MAG: hypothetical protein A2Y25_00385 [Candidatus Melainabacteria bacterium GWF2_37_15]|nr:MAG: hypothetical protein A2Y25_00385 [Candidatus Melainabacteria bacterium GWF2_37_15]
MSEELINEHLKKWESFKFEFLDHKDSLYQLDSSIEYVAKDYIIVNPPKFGGEKYHLPVNSEVSIVFYRSDGLLYGQTTILGQQAGFQSMLKISLPYNVNLVERRRSKRIRLGVRLDVEYYLNKNSMQRKVLNVSSYDISATGLSYLSEEPFGNFHNINCMMYLNSNLKDPVTAKCAYVGSRKKLIKNQPMYQIALEYTKIPQEDALRLQEKCYRKATV